jgi:hypothetical protein
MSAVQGPRRRAGFRLTERDDEMVRFAGMHMAVEARQISAWLDMGEPHVFRRAARLCELGLLERKRVLHSRPGAYIATQLGLDRVGLALPPARINLGQYEHAMELVWLFIELEREFGYGRVFAERELRSRELRALAEADRARQRHLPEYAVPLRSAKRGLHFPDLVVEWAGARGGALAVELELTSKGGGRRGKIIAAYLTAANVESVRYYAPTAVLRLVERTIEAERAGDVVQLHTWPEPGGCS